MANINIKKGSYVNKANLENGDIGFAKYNNNTGTFVVNDNGTLVNLMPAPGTAATKDKPLVSTGENTSPEYKTLPIAGGGTGATTASDALKNLGLDISAEDLNSIPNEFAGRALKTEGTFFVQGSGSSVDSTNEIATWKGSSNRFSSYYDGLSILYKLDAAGSSTVTLDINGLGAKTVYLFSSTKLKTSFPVNSIIRLTYHKDLHDGCWMCNDYDSNTNTQLRVYRQTSGYNSDYPLIASRTKASSIGKVGSNSSYTAVYGVMGNDTTKVPTLNPATGEIKAVKFTGPLNGIANSALDADHAMEADVAQKAVQDKNGNDIAAHYLPIASLKNVNLGQGYGTCAISGSTGTVTLADYVLLEGGIVSIKFNDNVAANTTLNINGAGTYSIYHMGAQIKSNIIKKDDVATFMYSNQKYHLISIDRLQDDINSIVTDIETLAESVDQYYEDLEKKKVDRDDVISIEQGGTGAKTASEALKSLGLTATATELNVLDGITASTAELNYVDGVTSNIQTQLNGKQKTIQGAASTITDNNLTVNRALISNSSGKVVVSDVTSTELGYLDGVTSKIQPQLDGKEPTITTLPISKGGTGTTSFVANRLLFYDKTDKKLISSGNYVSSSQLAINSTAMPTDSTFNLYVNGPSKFNGTIVKTNGHIYLDGATTMSTTNTTQIVFRQGEVEHIALSSNDDCFVINSSTSDSSKQIALYLGTRSTSTSTLPSKLSAAGFTTTGAISGGSLGISGAAKVKTLTISDTTETSHLSFSRSDGPNYIKAPHNIEFHIGTDLNLKNCPLVVASNYISPGLTGGSSLGTVSNVWKQAFVEDYQIYDSTNNTVGGQFYTTNSADTTAQPTYLMIGNSTPTGMAGNRYGVLRLYGREANYTDIIRSAETEDYTLHLPGASGQLVYHTHHAQIGSPIQPVYITETGQATACDTSASAAWFSSIPFINSNGIMGIGRYLDFHSTDTTAYDYSIRIDAGVNNKQNILYLPDVTGQVVVHKNNSIVGGTYAPVYIAASGLVTKCTSPAMLINLESASTDTVFKASPRPGVTGVLGVGNGGTGVATIPKDQAMVGNGTDSIQTKAITDNETGALSSDSTNLITERTVSYAIANLVESAPEALSTLNDLAAALGDDPNFATTILNKVGEKATIKFITWGEDDTYATIDG